MKKFFYSSLFFLWIALCGLQYQFQSKTESSPFQVQASTDSSAFKELIKETPKENSKFSKRPFSSELKRLLHRNRVEPSISNSAVKKAKHNLPSFPEVCIIFSCLKSCLSTKLYNSFLIKRCSVAFLRLTVLRSQAHPPTL